MKKKHILPNQWGPDVEFEGELLGSADSKIDAYKTRWVELQLYKTDKGFVCAQIGRTTIPDERDRWKVELVKTIAEALEFFGPGYVTKILMSRAGVSTLKY